MALNAFLPEETMQNNRRLGMFEGGTARVIFNLTSGSFMVGYLKLLGASDTICGYILSIPVLAATIQFLAPIVLEQLEFRKRIIILGSELHRLLLFSLIIIPFLPLESTVKLWTSAIIFLVSNLAVSFVSPAVSNMYVSFVLPKDRGKYFGTRESVILVIATIMNLVMGKVLDMFRAAGNERGGFVAVYVVILLMTAVNLWSYLNMKEVPLVHNPNPMKIKEVFTLPLKSPLFLRFFILSVSWNLSFMISASFYGVYQVNELAMSYTTINLLGMLSNIVYFAAAFLWGRIADKTGWAFTTTFSFLFVGITSLIWFFITKGPLMIPLMSIAMITAGLAWSGINISMFNLQYDFMPDERRTVYIGFNSTISGVLGYSASLIGSYLVGKFAHLNMHFMGTTIGIKQLLFLASGFLVIGCALYVNLFMNKNVSLKLKAKASAVSND